MAFAAATITRANVLPIREHPACRPFGRELVGDAGCPGLRRLVAFSMKKVDALPTAITGNGDAEAMDQSGDPGLLRDIQIAEQQISKGKGEPHRVVSRRLKARLLT